MPMEIQLKDWIHRLRSVGDFVSGEAIRKQEQQIYQVIHLASEQRTEEHV